MIEVFCLQCYYILQSLQSPILVPPLHAFLIKRFIFSPQDVKLTASNDDYYFVFEDYLYQVGKSMSFTLWNIYISVMSADFSPKSDFIIKEENRFPSYFGHGLDRSLHTD